MMDFSTMTLAEMRALNARLQEAMEKKESERENELWKALEQAYWNYIGEIGPITIALPDDDDCDTEYELNSHLVFSYPGQLSIRR